MGADTRSEQNSMESVREHSDIAEGSSFNDTSELTGAEYNDPTPRKLHRKATVNAWMGKIKVVLSYREQCNAIRSSMHRV